MKGPVRKMKTRLGSPVTYRLPLGDDHVGVNERLGTTLRIAFTGTITCTACGRDTRRTFQGGYCYPCSRALPAADACMVRPETCHFAAGTCRDPAWGELHCLRDHVVYLANASGLKVGITRGLDATGRWIDQGASQGLVVRRVATRLEAGLAEVSLKRFVADRTDWRRMLKGEPAPLDLVAQRERILGLHAEACPEETLPGEATPSAQPVSIAYPVLAYPDKVRAHDFDKEPLLEGTLLGIKGQYLILDKAVLNVRKYTGYHLSIDG